MSGVRVACVQLRSGLGRAKNFEATQAHVKVAHDRGAQLVITPEMTNVVDVNPKRLMGALDTESDTKELADFRALANSLGIWLLLGSLAIKLSDRRAANRSFLINPEGKIVARYDKLHMFDVDLEDGESYRESNVYEAGNEAIVADAAGARLGLSICYDLRFPHLYRALAQAGANVLCVPAAFTRRTGERHWHTLLRARAIETGAFVAAAAQGGRHEDGRETYGHSLIVSPSGSILAEKTDADPGVVVADLSLDEVQEVRASIPSLGLEAAFDVQSLA